MRWDRILYRKTVLNYLLYPLSLIFSGVLLLRRVSYRFGLYRVYNPEVRTISVGNIVSGGSGKTPFSIYLSRLLEKNGYKAAVSHRGYKGEFEFACRIISDRHGLRQEAFQAKDEPQLLAEKLPNIPVIAGKNREKAIKTLQKEFPDLDFIILDDSFQHLKVKKGFDFVLFNEITKFGNGFVLPAGVLRESLTALRYADCIVYYGSDPIPEKLTKTRKKIIRVQYGIKKLYLANGKELKADLLQKSSNVLISAIGQPDSFEKTLVSSGIPFNKHFRFPDHYDYQNQRIMDKLIENINRKYDYALTTEKDFTKLNKYKEKLPLVIVAVEVFSENERELLSMLQEHFRLQ